jgi:spore germination cell wall hydrolase CwlJ-like protein
MIFNEQDLSAMARTIYGEARGDLYEYGVASLMAVADVILNRRRKKFADSIDKVCRMPYQFSCWNEDDPNYKLIMDVTDSCAIFRKCLEVAQNTLAEKWPDLTDGCDHYHARSIKPHWALHRAPKRIFGSHYFYVLKN